MSSSKKTSRITRGSPPEKKIKRSKYRKALPELMRDFDGRCAYSMRHHTRAGELEVDHFDPRQKSHLIQDYANLFPVSRHCNGKKSDRWPTKEEIAAGLRFLNPCVEVDYGEQIVECPVTHELIGLTPAARWHIRMCGLNATHLTEERQKRAENWSLIRDKIVRIKGHSTTDALEVIEAFRTEVELMICEIEFAKLPKATPA